MALGGDVSVRRAAAVGVVRSPYLPLLSFALTRIGNKKLEPRRCGSHWFLFLVSKPDPSPRRVGGWILSKTNPEQRVLLISLLIKSYFYTSLSSTIVIVLEKCQWVSLMHLGAMEMAV